mmetsp:Transcript_13416/g.32782  ORF Transcript_13416/g.32782 Transcript_13416/m.32782 type:complete len:266 (+) Transcript_13416:3-800(+)
MAECIRSLVLATFAAAGLTINREKSTLEFVRRIEHLGFVIDLDKKRNEAPEKRWETFQSLLQNACTSTRVNVRKIAQITGHAMSMALALGPIAKLFKRNCYNVTSTFSLYTIMSLPDGVRQEVDFWLGLPRTGYTMDIWPTMVTSQCTINTDAGNRSWGAVMGNLKAQGYFPQAIRHCSSTLREMLGVWYALQAWGDKIRGKRVQIYVDNQAVERIVPAGSMKPAIHKVALNIFWLMSSLRVQLHVAWVPREQNKQAGLIMTIGS